MADNKKKGASATKKNAQKQEPERDEYAYYDDLYKKNKRKKNTAEQDEYDDAEDKPRRRRKKDEAEPEEPEKEIPPESTKTIHRFMPFILGIATVFVVACLLLASIDGAMGILGEVLRNLFFGLFGWPAWIIPIILINLIIYWRRYVDLGIVTRKVVFGCAIPVLLSSLVHSLAIAVLYENGYGWSEWGKSIFGIGADTISNWTYGITLHGGGFIGGLFGGFFRCLAGYIGSVIIIIAVLAVAIVFYFGLTPRQLTDAAVALYQKCREKAAALKAAKAEAKEAREDEDEEEELLGDEPPKRRRNVRGAAEREFDIDEVREDAPSGAVGTKNTSAGESYDPDSMTLMGSIETEHGKSLNKKTVDSLRPVNETEDPQTLPGLVDSIFGEQGESSVISDPIPEPAVLEISEAPVTDIRDEDPEPVVREDDGIVPPELAKKRREYEQLAAYIFPPISLLNESSSPGRDDIIAELRDNAQTLNDMLEAFKIKIAKIDYSRGPTLTRYELYPAPGTKASSIVSLQNDIALALKTNIRMQVPIPGKSAIGIEVPNKSKSTVAIRELLDSERFNKSSSKLFACLGKDITGEPIFVDIGKMPHLLIAGTTGSGKSVCINSIIMSILYKARPDEVQLIMIDPKKVEMAVYNNLPHLRVPVVTNVKKAAGTLNAAVTEMEQRYELFENNFARDIDGYNKMMKLEDPDFHPLPRVVIIIDELADLMMTAPTEIETSIVRLAQKARAAGIHLIVGTQRPSVDVITGLIKANIPSRIAFAVASGIDSRTIIDSVGAEKLLGRGDMLFSPIGSQTPIRVQGTLVNDDEVIAVTNFVKENSGGSHYDEEFLSQIEKESAQIVTVSPGGKKSAPPTGNSVANGECFDELFLDALRLAVESGTIATSFLQRNINVGFGRGARIIDRMAKLGFVTQPDGTKPRQVLLTAAQFAEMQARGDKRIYGIIPEDDPDEHEDTE
ncbi:MAG: DNA translocase FtsK [Eubacteriales bacterium]